MTKRGWWRGAVIYHVYPRSFRDFDGDGTGDLAGLIARLPYIRSLGVDAIWVAPFYAAGNADAGYDIRDHRAVDPRMGSQEDFDALVEQAHGQGLKILIDQVWSHTSAEHPWFEQSRSGRDAARHDWYVWADPAPGGGVPNNWLSVFGGPAWDVGCAAGPVLPAPVPAGRADAESP